MVNFAHFPNFKFIALYMLLKKIVSHFWFANLRARPVLAKNFAQRRFSKKSLCGKVVNSILAITLPQRDVFEKRRSAVKLTNGK